MDSLIQANIFFFITTVSIIFIALLVVVFLLYLIFIIRDIKKISKSVRREANLIVEDVSTMRQTVSKKGGNLINEFFNHLTYKVKKKRKKK